MDGNQEQICHVLWVIRPTNFHVQGVPRNKTEARRLEGCLYVLLKLATFICQPYFSSKILELRIPKYPYFWHFQNVVCLFCAFNTTRNIDSTKRADHILKIPGLGEFHGYYWSHESVQVKVG